MQSFFDHLFSDFFQGMFLEILIPVVTFGAGYAWKYVKYYFRFRTFSKVFGATEEQNFFIMLPDYKLIEKNDRSIPRMEKHELCSKRKEGFYGASEVYAQKDVEAAMEISSMFGGFFRRPIELINDASEPDDEKYCGIAIGSHIVNWFMRDIMTDFDTKLIPARLYQGTPPEKQYDCFYYDMEDDVYYNFDQGENELSAVFRVKNPYKSQGYIFLVFGIHDTGTFAAAKFLRENWTEFANEPELSGFLLKMKRGKKQQALIKKRYRAEKLMPLTQKEPEEVVHLH